MTRHTEAAPLKAIRPLLTILIAVAVAVQSAHCVSAIKKLKSKSASRPTSASLKAPANSGIKSITLSEKSGGVSVYAVTYMSGGLKVRGKLFVPDRAFKANAGEELPGLVFNHGGVGGIPSPFVDRCKQLARIGYVVFAPSYRGEDGSEGEIEVAAGEVDDALNGLKALRSFPFVDAWRVCMAGTSHGGIITLLAIQRDKSMKCAVSAYGVTNTYTWYKWLVETGHDVSDPLSVKVYGKGPEDKPEAFRRRAPSLDAHLIRTPLLLLYGEKDDTVPTTQGVELADALKPYGARFKLHIIPNVGHGFLFFLNPAKHTKEEMKSADAAWELMTDFLARQTDPDNKN